MYGNVTNTHVLMLRRTLYDRMYGSVINSHVKENPYMVVIPSSVLKKYRKILFDETLNGYIAITYFKK